MAYPQKLLNQGETVELDLRPHPWYLVPRISLLLLAIAVAALIWLLYTRTRFGFEAQVIGDSPRAARYAGMRTRRKIGVMLCLSGAVAGIGGDSQMGDFRHTLDARGLQQAYYGYTGIVVAALARYNPNGTLDPSFSGNGRQRTNLVGFDEASAVALQADGKSVAVGRSFGTDLTADFALARYLGG